MLRPRDTRSIDHKRLASCSLCLRSLPENFEKGLVEIALWKDNVMFQREGWVFYVSLHLGIFLSLFLFGCLYVHWDDFLGFTPRIHLCGARSSDGSHVL